MSELPPETPTPPPGPLRPPGPPLRPPAPPAAPEAPASPPAWHPVRIVVTDDLHRSRLTVFFRLLLGIPHYLWAALLGTAVIIVVFLQWWILLFTGRPSVGMRDFTAGFIRYVTHIMGYVLLAANPFPGFYPMSTGPYPVDLEIDPAEPQNRWKTFFRVFLVIPAALISGVLLGGGPRSGGGLAFAAAFLLWWVGLFCARSPRGLRDLVVYCLGFAAQYSAYILLVTDRYPYSGPNAFVPARTDEEPHPVSMSVSDDLRRSRLTVFFRLPLAIPHIVWLVLWGILVLFAALLNWISALAIGRAPRPFHRFISAYLRYETHVYAFLFLVGNQFPGFVGKRGSYPVELVLPDEPQTQKRLVTLFRLLLAFPAIIIASGVSSALLVVAFLGWFVGLIQGRMPDGLRNLGAYTLRYTGQMNAYFYVLTDRYPDSGPRQDPASP